MQTEKNLNPATNNYAEEIFSADLYPGEVFDHTRVNSWKERPVLRDSRFVVISLEVIRHMDYQPNPDDFDHIVFNFQYDEDITSDDIAYFIRLKNQIRDNNLSYTCIGMSHRCVQFLELLGIDNNLEFVH
ncbi:MAG: hypothetical protein COB51_06580 [Moraxellaceae bacterium]|nr:MAG: hypothetical protein COB51_06580 [Moraxellaceae bacterium]